MEKLVEFTGILKKVPKAEHFKQYRDGELDLKSLSLEDTVSTIDTQNGDLDTLSVRLTKKEVDEKGNEKFILNEESGEYEPLYVTSPSLSATGKELRILLDLGELVPVKIIANEICVNERTYFNIKCIQDQRLGLSGQ